MEIVSNGGEDFKRLGLKFRALGKDGAAIRRATTKRIQALMAKIVADQKTALAALDIRGVKAKSDGKGGTSARRGSSATSKATQRRQAFHQSAALRGKKVRARREGYGLRAQVARGIKSKVSWSGRKLGARISVETSHLPPSQRNLPRHIDNPRGWRHPVWGNRKVWAGSVGGPYFSGPIQRWRNTVRREIQDEITQLLRTLK